MKYCDEKIAYTRIENLQKHEGAGGIFGFSYFRRVR